MPHAPNSMTAPAHFARGFNRMLDRVAALVAALAACLLAAIVVIVFANVVARYGFRASFTWANEAAQFLFIAVIFLGLPLARRTRLQMSIDLWAGVLPPGLRAAQRIAIDAVVAYTLIHLGVSGGELITLIGGASVTLGTPNWLHYAVIPASAALALLFLVGDAGARRLPVLCAVGFAIAAYLAIEAAALVAFPRASPSLVMAIVFLVTLLIGVPVAFAMLFSAFAANLVGDLLPAAAIVQNIVRGAGQFLLIAIPLFLVAGALMNAGGLTDRLIDFARAMVGHLRGGLAQVNVVASVMYSGVSGSSNANAALGAKTLAPHMIRAGYAPGFSCAVTASSAVLDNIIPPSIAMLILAASVPTLSVGALYVAGFLPGLVYAGAIMLVIWALARRHGYGALQARASAAVRARSVARMLPVLMVGVIIVAGMRLGIATPTEAGALAVVYAFLIGKFAFRAFTWVELARQMRVSALETASIGLLIGAATPFSFVLASENVPQRLVAAMTEWFTQPWLILLAINLVMLAAGMVLDIGAAILILAPLFFPVVERIGVDPIHFGLIVVCNLMLGGLTPPVGILAYITASVAQVPARAVFVALTPFVLALLAALALITYIPAIALGLGWIIG
jgi:tripartite ATP-independent transporter DctM subunit